MSAPKSSLNQKIHAELRLLAAQRLLRDEQVARIAERYPTGPWDLVSLARWMTLLGAVTLGGGIILLAAKLDHWQTLLEVALSGLVVGLLALGRWLDRRRGLRRTRAALELTASLVLQALTTELAVHYSRGSDNWPGLIGVQAGLALALAYGLGNRLVLIHAVVCAFVFFGGETGYASDWGAYWLGMNYPARFVAIGLGTLGVAWLHAQSRDDGRRSFSRVYLHFGLLVTHFALWFFAVFGYFETTVRWNGTEAQRLAFSALWAAVSLASIPLSRRLGLGTPRSYGIVFLVIDVYTFYFQFVVPYSLEIWWLHMLIVGGTLVMLALRAERRRRTTMALEAEEAAAGDDARAAG